MFIACTVAVNDCGQYVNGVGQGTRYEGTFTGATQRFGNCADYQDYTQWPQTTRDQLRDFGYAQMDATRN
jgi:glucan 1,3-beta-glucosidase